MGKNSGDRKEILNKLPDYVSLKKNEVCKYLKICPFKTGCLGIEKNDIRDDYFFCDLKVLKEKYKKIIPKEENL